MSTHISRELFCSSRAYAITLSLLTLVLGAQVGVLSAAPIHAGPLFDEFDLTLTPGHRTEALGPFFYQQDRESSTPGLCPPCSL